MYRLSLLTACCAILSGADQNPAAGDLKNYVADSAKAATSISDDRRKLLDPIVKSIAGQLKKRGETSIVFVCTHNSRRSQFSQVWAHTAAAHYGLTKVRFASGGTEATAANIRTILALRRAGFSIKETTVGVNPVYTVSKAGATAGCRLFSKTYFDKSNPQREFVAVVCCSDADEKCPIVKGAAARFPLHYVDPKVSDGTPKEEATYDERCRQIAAEMFYLISGVKQSADASNRK